MLRAGRPKQERTGSGKGFLMKAVPISPMHNGNVHDCTPPADGEDFAYGLVSHPNRVSSRSASPEGGWSVGSDPPGVVLRQPHTRSL